MIPLVFMYAYYGMLTEFKSEYEERFEDKYLAYIFPFCLARGCFVSLEFSKYVYDNSLYMDSSIVCKNVARTFLQNNIFYNDYINVELFYPYAAFKEFCLQLIEKEPRYTSIIVKLSIILGWKDIYDRYSEDTYINKRLIYKLNVNRDYNMKDNDVISNSLYFYNLYNDYFNVDPTFPPKFSEESILFEETEAYFIDLAIKNPHILPVIKENEFTLDELYKNSYTACRVFTYLSDKYKDICISRFIWSGYINENLISKYKPILIPFKYKCKIPFNRIVELYYRYVDIRPILI